MPIFRNVMKCDENKGDIMGYNEQGLFGTESLFKSSELP